MLLQKGEAPEALAAAKKELDIKRAASASKGAKVFYKVTVKVSAFPALLLRKSGIMMPDSRGHAIELLGPLAHPSAVPCS